MNDIKSLINEVVKKLSELRDGCNDWIKVEDSMPEDTERVVVRTKDGATYFLSPINGRFPQYITHWYRLPQINN